MAGSRAFWVYVIELDPAGVSNVGNGYLYVGETAKTPEERFAQHLSGRRSGRGVAARAVRLRPDLYPPENPFSTRDEAQRFEKQTADRLRESGYKVRGGQGEPFMSNDRRSDD